MKKFCRAVALLLVSALMPVSIFSLTFFDDMPPEELAAALVDAMTDEQALSQVIMLGWVGADPSPQIMEWIRRRDIGGVKVFGWNTNDTTRLARAIGQMQQASLQGRYNIPLLVATDQEGGWVRHVRGKTSQTPGNMAIGASGYPRDAYLAGYYIGRELALLGINMNFAPTVDVFNNRDSFLIGPRSFGDDPVSAGILGAAFMRGQMAAGVIPTAKHYPGHGDTALDSHGVLPVIDIDFETLWERELVPYRMLAAEGLPAVMSGHLSFPGIKTTAGAASADAPASLSRWFMHDVLREQVGFNGLVITDDLRMHGAIGWSGSISRAAKQALAAGNDIILFSTTLGLNDTEWNYLYRSMREEPDFRLRVRDAARKTLELKLRHLRGNESVPFIPDLQKVEAGLPDPDGREFFLNLAARSVTVVKPSPAEAAAVSHQNETRSGSVFPLTRESAGRVLLAGQDLEFFRLGRIAYPGATAIWYSEVFGVDQLLQNSNRTDTVIFHLSNNEGVRMLQPLQRLRKKTVVFSTLSPVHMERVPWVDGIVAVYSTCTESIAAGFSAILGRIPAAGTLPYEL